MNVSITEDEYDALFEVYDCWSTAQENSDVPREENERTANLVWNFFEKYKRARERHQNRELKNRVLRVAKKYERW